MGVRRRPEEILLEEALFQKEWKQRVDCSARSRRSGEQAGDLKGWPRGRKLAASGEKQVGVCHFG